MDEEHRLDERLCFNTRRVTPQKGATRTDQPGGGLESTYTLRDLLAIGFRFQRLVVVSFVVIVAMVLLFVSLRPAQYEAQMKILVKRERVDPLVTPEESAQRPLFFGVTEEELNSEVELLKSRDLLTQVVVEVGLHKRNETGLGARLWQLLRRADQAGDESVRIAAAVQQIARQMDVQPLRKSNVIQVSYASPDPALSAAVLRTLADRYVEKHLTVHRPSGTFNFFDHETERYGGQLARAQARLDEQNRVEGVVSAQVEREQALKQLGELEATKQTTEAEIAATDERIRVLETQLASTSARTTTEIRHGSAALLENLHSTLVTYELKRIELLSVFQSSYPPLQEVEAQIAKVQAAIEAAEKSPLVEETTNRNPTYDYLVAELAKSRAELAGLHARAAATGRSLAVSRVRAWRLEELGRSQQALVHTAAQAEQNYVIYSRKREEARISNALDAQRILNVAIAEQAAVPSVPSGLTSTVILLLGVFVAGLVSVVLAGVANYLDPSFRTPDEVESFLGSPAFAAIPRTATPAHPAV